LQFPEDICFFESGLQLFHGPGNWRNALSELIQLSVLAQSNQSDPNMIPSSLPLVYGRWVDEDVRWIITPDERKAFLRLSENDERDQFVERFWLRRDPTPNTTRNEFKAEHYRRIAYAGAFLMAGSPRLENGSWPHLHHLRLAGRD
jgi:hypothetical protein